MRSPTTATPACSGPRASRSAAGRSGDLPLTAQPTCRWLLSSLLGERDLGALADGQTHRARHVEVARDVRAGADDAALEADVEEADPRVLHDDRVLDLRAVDLRARADRAVGPDVGVRDLDVRTDDRRAAHEAVVDLRRRVHSDRTLDLRAEDALSVLGRHELLEHLPVGVQ